MRKVAKRYARALLMVAKEEGAIQSVDGELQRVGAILRAQGELWSLLNNPAFDTKERQELLREVLAPLSVSTPTLNLLFILIENNRFNLLFDIIDYYRTLCDEATGRIRARILTPHPMPIEEVELLKRRLAQITGREVVAEVSLDPPLIGGLVVKMGGLIIDGSIRGQLERMRERLEEE